MRPRTVLLIGTLSLSAGWWVGNTTAPQAQDTSAPRERSGPRPLGSSPRAAAPFTQQLRERMQERPRTPVRGRNPFVFGQRPAFTGSGRGPRPAERPPDPLPPPMPVEPPRPIIRLSGIASDRVDGAQVLTAIISDNGRLVFAKAGDALSNGYRIVSVDELSIVIVDADGVTQTLRLP